MYSDQDIQHLLSDKYDPNAVSAQRFKLDLKALEKERDKIEKHVQQVKDTMATPKAASAPCQEHSLSVAPFLADEYASKPQGHYHQSLTDESLRRAPNLGIIDPTAGKPNYESQRNGQKAYGEDSHFEEGAQQCEE